ncbi:peptide chain release factor N(5)-glutamine methyltransferase [Flavihumibacter sp. R14]|nr:peptide chain release factor N(5)-glutamine methyltransferase [Flavihumibacter soli]
MTIRELEKLFIEQLTILYDFQEAQNIAWLAISSVRGLNRLEYLGAKNDKLKPDDENKLLEILQALNTGMPLQYALGETEFYGLPFKVNPAVLIPRPETEELVDWILKDLHKQDSLLDLKDLSILDIGTGSGCIPIVLKKNLPQADVTGIDISPGAIEAALENAAVNQVEVRFMVQDVFELADSNLNHEFSIVVSNPPYVTLSEKNLMHQNVLQFEPHNALFVSDEDPLVFYNAISDFAKNNLEANGLLYLEINESYGEATKLLLENKGFHEVEVREDLRGRERMIKAKNAASTKK